MLLVVCLLLHVIINFETILVISNPEVSFALQKWRQEAKNNIAASKVFANENFMNFSTLMTLVGIKAQFLDYLVTIGFVPENCRMHQKRSGQDRILDITGPEVSLQFVIK